MAVEYHQQTTTKHAASMRNDSLAEKRYVPKPHDLISEGIRFPGSEGASVQWACARQTKGLAAGSVMSAGGRWLAGREV